MPLHVLPETLSSVLSKVKDIENKANAALVDEFYSFMKSNGTSESYRKNNIKAVIIFAKSNIYSFIMLLIIGPVGLD